MGSNINLDSLTDEQKQHLIRRLVESNPAYKDKLFALNEATKKARIAAAREDPNVFVPYILTDEETGSEIWQAPAHRAYQDMVSKNDRCIIHGHVESGKAIPLDTPIPTPGGFVLMGDLKVGDTVYDRFGAETKVTFVTETQYNHDVYEITFSDGTTATADADHQWAVWTLDDRASNKPTRVVTTREIASRVKRGRDFMWKIPVCCNGVDFQEKPLLVHPYVLGCWLGDGDSQGPQFTCHVNDKYIVDRCIALENGVRGKWRTQGDNVLRIGVGVNSHTKCSDSALSRRLKKLNVVNNKHIPDVYKVSSREQRLELLRGLMDTDGYASNCGNGRVEFCSVNKRLADDVAEIARSLGQRVTVISKRMKLHGKFVGVCWRVCWTSTIQCFSLDRKARLVPPRDAGLLLEHKTIVGVKQVPSVPVRCISVDAPTRTYLMGREYTVTHNTQQLSIGRVLYELGRNPNLRIVIFKATQDDAKKILATISSHILHNTRLKEVFPHLEPMPGAAWNTEQITVKRRTGIKDPSVRVIGVHGNILGARIDFLVGDDFLNMENTRTQHQRNDVYNWIKGTLLGRMSGGMDGSNKIVFLGNAWHPDDPMFRLAADGWPHGVFPVRDPLTKKSLWPERWSEERIREAFSARGMGPLEAARALDCQARSEEASRFRQEWIDKCLALGKELDMPFMYDPPPGHYTFTGVDLGVGKEITHDWTVLFTVEARPDGKLRVLYIEMGKWTSPEIVKKIEETHTRYNSKIIVESNAAQRYIVQFVKDKNKRVPIVPFTTRGSKTINNKHHPEYGVEGIANELANGMWIIPSDANCQPLNNETKAWIQDMLYFDPLGHTGDTLMASWIAREGAKRNFRHALNEVEVRRIGHNYDAETEEQRAARRSMSVVDRKRQALQAALSDITSGW